MGGKDVVERCTLRTSRQRVTLMVTMPEDRSLFGIITMATKSVNRGYWRVMLILASSRLQNICYNTMEAVQSFTARYQAAGFEAITPTTIALRGLSDPVRSAGLWVVAYRSRQ